jgi:AraC-like DNA-binding protein
VDGDLRLLRHEPIRRSIACDPLVESAARALARDAGNLTVERLARELGVNRRQLERRFAAEVGLSPKEVAGVYRFRRALASLCAGGAAASVAVSCGYFDQSHMTRDFKRYSGRTPHALVEAVAS